MAAGGWNDEWHIAYVGGCATLDADEIELNRVVSRTSILVVNGGAGWWSMKEERLCEIEYGANLVPLQADTFGPLAACKL